MKEDLGTQMPVGIQDSKLNLARFLLHLGDMDSVEAQMLRPRPKVKESN